jgi:hypothetical protein
MKGIVWPSGTMNQKLLSGVVMRAADVPHDFVLFIARIKLRFLLLEGN